MYVDIVISNAFNLNKKKFFSFLFLFCNLGRSFVYQNQSKLNLSFDMGVVPMDWHGARIVPLYKGKGDKCECSNSRGICLLSVVGKLYGRVLIKRVRAGTECAIVGQQCGFRQGRGYMDQVFAVRQVCEKYLANGKYVF